MAIFRQLHTEFWQDDLMMELTPEDKYFYIYLLTNSKVTQCGIFKFNKRIASLETGYSVDTVARLLERFIGYGKILYSKANNEVMILNWHKYNVIHNNKNTRICINKELKRIKSKEFIQKFYEICLKLCKKDKSYLTELFDDVDMLSEGTIISCNEIPEDAENPTSSTDESLDMPKADKPESHNKATSGTLVKIFNENIHPISSLEYEKLMSWCDDMEPEVVIKAIEEAVNKNARNMAYINSILNNWLKTGMTTKAHIDAYYRDRSYKNKNYKNNSFSHPSFKTFENTD